MSTTIQPIIDVDVTQIRKMLQIFVSVSRVIWPDDTEAVSQGSRTRIDRTRTTAQEERGSHEDSFAAEG
ncbi:hypothetical protein ANO11243_053610 [Dothideomycetidae sp. 11243]|nr:hypothetical protein ANO11243_053610 [fungal sp. No.11243]